MENVKVYEKIEEEKLYYIVRKGTNERYIEKGVNPLIVTERVLTIELGRIIDIGKSSGIEYEPMAVVDYQKRFERSLFENLRRPGPERSERSERNFGNEGHIISRNGHHPPFSNHRKGLTFTLYTREDLNDFTFSVKNENLLVYNNNDKIAVLHGVKGLVDRDIDEDQGILDIISAGSGKILLRIVHRDPKMETRLNAVS